MTAEFCPPVAGVCVLLLSPLTVSAGELMEVKTISETPSRIQIYLLLLSVYLSVCPAVSLSVSPNLQQFFSTSFSVLMSCVDDGQTVDGWTVKAARGGHTDDCGAAADFRRVNSSFCVLDPSISSGGNFFCENSSGQQSDGVAISVSGTVRCSQLSLFDSVQLVELSLYHSVSPLVS